MYVLVNTFGACVVRIFGLLECFWTRLRDEEVGCLFGVICDEVWGCEEVLVENVLQAVLVVLVPVVQDPAFVAFKGPSVGLCKPGQ